MVAKFLPDTKLSLLMCVLVIIVGHGKDEGRSLGTSGACRMPLPSLLESLGQVFNFFWSEVICGDEEVIPIISDTDSIESIVRFLHPCSSPLGRFDCWSFDE